MKQIIFFPLFALLCSCSSEEDEEEMIDLDQMAYAEQELDTSHLAGEPTESPQEILITEDP